MADFQLSPSQLVLRAYVYAVLVFVVLPILVILPMAFSEAGYLTFPPKGFTLNWFIEYFQDSSWQQATRLSLQVAVLTAFLSSTIGTMAAYAMVRGPGRFAPVLQILVIGPLIVPQIALAVSLTLYFQMLGMIGTIPAFVLAHTVMAMPFVIFVSTAALSRVDAALEAAAMSCGASRFAAFRLVTLPLILPNVIGGALFAFIISFDEPVVSFFISSIRQKTLPRRMFDDIEQNLTPIIPAIAVILTILSFSVALVAYWLTSTREEE